MSALEAFHAASEQRRALVAIAMSQAHEACARSYKYLSVFEFHSWVIKCCSQAGRFMVMQNNAKLPVPSASVENVYETFAAWVRQHPDPQVALDAHAAVKAIHRKFLEIANSPEMKRKWSTAGICLARATDALMAPQGAALKTPPAAAQT